MSRLTLIFLFLISCSTASYVVNVKEDVTYKKGNNTAKQAKAGDEIDSDEAMLIEAPGKVSVLVMPADEGETEYSINLRPLEGWVDSASLDAEKNKVIGEVFTEFLKAQRALSQRRPQDCLRIIDDVLKKNENFTFLRFIQSACSYAGGDKQKANEYIEIALKDFPNNADGLQLKKIINGDTP